MMSLAEELMRAANYRPLSADEIAREKTAPADQRPAHKAKIVAFLAGKSAERADSIALHIGASRTHTHKLLNQLIADPKDIVDWGRAALLHDAAEAYLGDITRPLKQLLPEYKAIERRVEEALFASFSINLTPALSSAIKAYDLVLLATEQRDLMPPHDDEWALIKGVHPMQDVINPWGPEKAYREFMKRWTDDLMGGVE